MADSQRNLPAAASIRRCAQYAGKSNHSWQRLIVLCHATLAQFGLAPENLTTLAHFSVSSAMSRPKSAGEPVSAVPPKSVSRALILRSARPVLISLLSLPTMSAGVFLGTPTPYHWLAS